MINRQRHPADALIDEVRQRRRDLPAPCGNDLGVWIRSIREQETRHPERFGDPRITPKNAAHG